MVKKRSGNKKVLGKVNVPKGMFAYVKKGTVYGFSPKKRPIKKSRRAK